MRDQQKLLSNEDAYESETQIAKACADMLDELEMVISQARREELEFMLLSCAPTGLYVSHAGESIVVTDAYPNPQVPSEVMVDYVNRSSKRPGVMHLSGPEGLRYPIRRDGYMGPRYVCVQQAEGIELKRLIEA